MNFVAKTIFIKTLGQDYLGVNTLFGNIVNLLSLTELGLNSAIMFSLYRPLNENNEKKISAIINYSRSIFNKIALTIAAIGICIIPTLKYVVNSEIKLNYIIWYYLLYLITVAVTYLATYKTTLISADEKDYIVKTFYTVFNALRVFVQIILLITTKNFTLYLIAGIIFNLLFNAAITIKVNKDYPFLNDYKNEQLTKTEKKDLYRNTKAVFKNKIASLVLNNTDNIIISSMLTTTIVGQYSGYTTIYTTLIGLLGNFYSGIIHTIGKLNISEDANKKHETFNMVHLLLFMLASITSMCFFFLADDFINLWIGNAYIMEKSILIAIIINFYIYIIHYPVEIYKLTTRLFIKTQNIVILTAISNIILSIALAKYFGLFGILIATGISKLITTFWSEPYVLFRQFFDCSLKDYLLYILKIILEVIFVTISCFILSSYMNNITADTWGHLILKGIICLSISFIITFVALLSSGTFRKIVKRIFHIIMKNRK